MKKIGDNLQVEMAVGWSWAEGWRGIASSWQSMRHTVNSKRFEGG
jgi:hypothetical protein